MSCFPASRDPRYPHRGLRHREVRQGPPGSPTPPIQAPPPAPAWRGRPQQPLVHSWEVLRPPPCLRPLPSSSGYFPPNSLGLLFSAPTPARLPGSRLSRGSPRPRKGDLGYRLGPPTGDPGPRRRRKWSRRERGRPKRGCGREREGGGRREGGGSEGGRLGEGAGEEEEGRREE